MKGVQGGGARHQIDPARLVGVNICAMFLGKKKALFLGRAFG